MLLPNQGEIRKCLLLAALHGLTRHSSVIIIWVIYPRNLMCLLESSIWGASFSRRFVWIHGYLGRVCARRSSSRTLNSAAFQPEVTNIQLDDFSSTLARLLERLRIEEPEGREWATMAMVNISVLL